MSEQDSASLTRDINTLHMAAFEARQAQRGAQRALALREAWLRCDSIEAAGGAKNVGANEQEREDRFRLRFVGDDEWRLCFRILDEAERMLALSEAEIIAFFLSREETSGLLLHMHMEERFLP